MCIAPPTLRRVAAADNCKSRHMQRIDTSVYVQGERWPGNLREHLRVGVLAPGDQVVPVRFEPVQCHADGFLIGNRNRIAFFSGEPGLQQTAARLVDDVVSGAVQIEQCLKFGYTQVSVLEYQPGAVMRVHHKIIPRRRIAPRGINCEEWVLLARVTNRVVNVNRLRGVNHEAIADPIECLEDHDGAGLLFRKSDLTATKAIVDLFASLEN